MNKSRRKDDEPRVLVVFDTSYILKPTKFKKLVNLYAKIHGVIPKVVEEELKTLSQDPKADKKALENAKKFMDDNIYSRADTILDLKNPPVVDWITDKREFADKLTPTQKMVIQTALHYGTEKIPKDRRKKPPEMVLVAATLEKNPIREEIVEQRKRNLDFFKKIHCISKDLLEFEEIRWQTINPPKIAAWNWYITSFMVFALFAILTYITKSWILVAITLSLPYVIYKALHSAFQRREKRNHYVKLLDSR